MKAVFYGRYSTDMQDSSSLERQYRNCQLRAEREGWTIVERYQDPSISGGTRMRERPEGGRLLADAEAGKFDVVLVDDLSRAFRHEGDQHDTLELLRYYGVHVIGVSDGTDTRDENCELSTGMHGLINARYRKDLGKKVHSQLALIASKGKNAGGLGYGYRVVYDTVVDVQGRSSSRPIGREIVPEKAKWVVWIFEQYAAGWSPRKIADELNRLNVPSPGSSWNRTTRQCRGWLGSAIRPMLQNDLYRGRQVWNKSRWVEIPPEVRRRKNLKWRKQRIERPPSEWIVTEVSALRIINDELWEQVQARLHAKPVATPSGHGPSYRKYLFSGLLKCGVCGAAYVVRNSAGYGCSTYTNGGKRICGNKLIAPRKLVEERLLAAIQRELFTPEGIELFVQETTRLLAEQRRQASETDPARDLARLDQEIENLMVAIRAGTFSPALQAALEKAERQKQQLLSTRRAAPLAKLAAFLPDAVARYRRLVEDLPAALGRDVDRARAQLRKLLGGEITLHPTERGLEAELRGSYSGLVSLALGPSTKFLHSPGSVLYLV